MSNSLISRYLQIVETDNYEHFGELLTEDCKFTLMPSGRTFMGRDKIMAFTVLAGSSRTHDEKAKVTIKNWFTDGQKLCVEYVHEAVVKRPHMRVRIDGYCWVFHIREGKFDEMREYINPPSLLMGVMMPVVLRAAGLRLKSGR